MVEQNPLQVMPLGGCSNAFSNKRGRPRNGNIIRFGPQPQSMVAKLLLQIKADSESNHTKDVVPRSPSPECDSNLNLIVNDEDSEPKTKKKTKISEPTKPKIYSCNFENCSYATKQASNMTKHMRVHSGDKPYLCDRCSFRTNFINSLKCHKRLHTDNRPYKCADCSYSCNSVSNLKKHFHTRHKADKIDTPPC